MTANVGPVPGVAGLQAVAAGIPTIALQLRDDYEDGELIPLVVYEWADIQQLANGAEAYL